MERFRKRWSIPTSPRRRKQAGACAGHRFVWQDGEVALRDRGDIGHGRTRKDTEEMLAEVRLESSVGAIEERDYVVRRWQASWGAAKCGVIRVRRRRIH